MIGFDRLVMNWSGLWLRDRMSLFGWVLFRNDLWKEILIVCLEVEAGV